MIVTIIGGGNVAHAIAGIIGTKTSDKLVLNILTRQPEKWTNFMTVSFSMKQEIVTGHINGTITNNAADVVPFSDIIIISAPAYSFNDICLKIEPYVKPHTIMMALPGIGGWYLIAKKYKWFMFVNNCCSLRTPFISRIIEYGKKVMILGFVNGPLKLHVGCNVDFVRLFIKDILNLDCDTSCKFCDTFLVNSNNILHPCNIYSIVKRQDKLKHLDSIRFYLQWDNYTSELVKKCDSELSILWELFGASSCLNTLYKHYEVENENELTNKIHRLFNYKNGYISTTPLFKGGYINTECRYIQENFIYGICLFHIIAIKSGVEDKIPTIKMLSEFGLNILGKNISDIFRIYY